MNFFWECQTPDKGWWANYRWHRTEPCSELGIKDQDWKKSFFRAGWQNKVLKVESVEEAKKCLKALQNETITAFGGRFRGASYDKNAERMIKQAKKSLKEAIKNNDKGENINVKETAIIPTSYYNWGKIIGISGAVLLIVVVLIVFLVVEKNSQKVKKHP